MQVHVIETKVANIASMLAALKRINAQPVLTQDPKEVMIAQAVVLPGVGAFGAGMARLEELGLGDALRARAQQDLPTLCVCLGLQLLSQESEESPGVSGLGILDVKTIGFIPSKEILIPQLGWNHVQPDEGCTMLEPGYAYFANSYHLADTPTGWRAAHSVHGQRFISAVERGHWLACQFHPELSGGWGQALMQRWLTQAQGEAR